MLVLAEEERRRPQSARARSAVAAALRRRARQFSRRHPPSGDHRQRRVEPAARARRCSDSGSSGTISPKGARRWPGCSAMPEAAAPTRLRGTRAVCGIACSRTSRGTSTRPSRSAMKPAPSIVSSAIIQGVATTMIVLAWQAQHRGRYAEATRSSAKRCRCGSSWATARRWTWRAATWRTPRSPRGISISPATSSSRWPKRRSARGDARGVASALNGLGDLAASQGDPDAARQFYQQSLNGYRQINDHWGIATVLTDVANIDLQAADYAAANRCLIEALQVFRKLGHQRGVARQLESLSWCASCQSRDAQAVALASAAGAIRQKVGTPPKQAEREKIDQTLALAKNAPQCRRLRERLERGAHGPARSHPGDCLDVAVARRPARGGQPRLC